MEVDVGGIGRWGSLDLSNGGVEMCVDARGIELTMEVRRSGSSG